MNNELHEINKEIGICQQQKHDLETGLNNCNLKEVEFNNVNENNKRIIDKAIAENAVLKGELRKQENQFKKEIEELQFKLQVNGEKCDSEKTEIINQLTSEKQILKKSVDNMKSIFDKIQVKLETLPNGTVTAAPTNSKWKCYFCKYLNCT